jgi:hypothetical protein
MMKVSENSLQLPVRSSHCRRNAAQQAVEADGRPQTAAHRLTAKRWADDDKHHEK